MPRYIDADRMIKGLPRLCHQVAKSNTCRACPLFDTEDDYCRIERFIEEQPEAEDGKVVKCKECRYSCRPKEYFKNDPLWKRAILPPGFLICEYMGEERFVCNGFYCANGKRRKKPE